MLLWTVMYSIPVKAYFIAYKLIINSEISFKISFMINKTKNHQALLPHIYGEYILPFDLCIVLLNYKVKCLVVYIYNSHWFEMPIIL